jgi:transposase
MEVARPVRRADRGNPPDESSAGRPGPTLHGLCGLVRGSLRKDPLSGDVFVFVNRRRTHIKLLVWDRSGFVLYYKRLERGTFELPDLASEGYLSWSQLMLMLEGVALRTVRYRKRYSLGPKGVKSAA